MLEASTAMQPTLACVDARVTVQRPRLHVPPHTVPHAPQFWLSLCVSLQVAEPASGEPAPALARSSNALPPQSSTEQSAQPTVQTATAKANRNTNWRGMRLSTHGLYRGYVRAARFCSARANT